MRAHTGAKIFRCHMCDRAFAQNRSLTSHMIRVHQVDVRNVEYDSVTNDPKESVGNQTGDDSSGFIKQEQSGDDTIGKCNVLKFLFVVFTVDSK